MTLGLTTSCTPPLVPKITAQEEANHCSRVIPGTSPSNYPLGRVRLVTTEKPAVHLPKQAWVLSTEEVACGGWVGDYRARSILGKTGSPPWAGANGPLRIVRNESACRTPPPTYLTQSVACSMQQKITPKRGVSPVYIHTHRGARCVVPVNTSGDIKHSLASQLNKINKVPTRFFVFIFTLG